MRSRNVKVNASMWLSMSKGLFADVVSRAMDPMERDNPKIRSANDSIGGRGRLSAGLARAGASVDVICDQSLWTNLARAVTSVQAYFHLFRLRQTGIRASN